MHTTRFNSRRFAALLRSDWGENRNTYLMFLIGAYIITAIALTASHIDLYAETLPVKEVLDQREGLLPGMDQGWKYNKEILSVAFFAFMLLSVRTFRTKTLTRGQTLRFLLFPATMLEKFTRWWLYVVPFSLVAFPLIYWAADLTRILICRAVFPGTGLDKLADVEEAVANFAAACCRKLREGHIACGSLTVFSYTSRFRTDIAQDYLSADIHFPVATNDLQEIVSASVKGLRRFWKGDGNYLYKKAGVLVWDIHRENEIQGNLFDTIDREKHRKLMNAIDEINRKNGHNTIRIATQGYSKAWHLKNEYISKQYTTNLDDVIVLKLT